MSTLQDSAVHSSNGVDPRTVSISGYVIDECYAPETVATTDPADPKPPPPRTGPAAPPPDTRPPVLPRERGGPGRRDCPSSGGI